MKRALFLALLLAAAPSWAQGDRERARTIGREGLELFDQGRWEQAYEKLAEAERLHHAPTLVLFMARARRNQSRLLEARRLYEQLVDEKLDAGAPEQFRGAKDTAYRELRALERQIPSVLVVGASDVTIDGAAVADLARPVPLDPGEHTIAGRTADGSEGRRVVTLAADGKVVRVELGEAEPAPAEAEPADAAEPDEPSSFSYVPAIVAFAAGGAGMAVGIATGVMAKSRADDIKSRCDDVHCLTTDAELGDEARTLATVSTVGFVVGGVALGAGVVLVAIAATSEEPTPGAGGTAWRLRISPTSLSSEVRF
jgi:hypothetical protein